LWRKLAVGASVWAEKFRRRKREWGSAGEKPKTRRSYNLKCRISHSAVVQGERGKRRVPMEESMVIDLKILFVPSVPIFYISKFSGKVPWGRNPEHKRSRNRSSERAL